MVTTAAQLAAADIVLTTYEVLRKDAWRMDVPERSLRFAKRYEVGTPLSGPFMLALVSSWPCRVSICSSVDFLCPHSRSPLLPTNEFR